MKIENIIFDLGGVILNIDLRKSIEAFKVLGAKNANGLFRNNKAIIKEFSRGLMDAATFRNAMKNKLKITVSDKVFDNAWNAMLINFPKQKLEIISKLKKDYHCFLFSNTNIIHHQCVINILQRDCNSLSFAKYFEKEYYSYLMGLSKPDKTAFVKIIKENHLIVNETIFIDDTLENIKAAASVGLHVLHINNDLTLANISIYIKRIESKSV